MILYGLLIIYLCYLRLVSWDGVFMHGEWRSARRLAILFATYHRHSYVGCKPAITDIDGGYGSSRQYNGILGFLPC